MGATCVSNNDSTYNYKCSPDGNFNCTDPSLWAIYADTVDALKETGLNFSDPIIPDTDDL